MSLLPQIGHFLRSFEQKRAEGVSRMLSPGYQNAEFAFSSINDYFCKKSYIMKPYLVLFVTAMLVYSCSKEELHVPDRPGAEPEQPVLPEIRDNIDFSDTNISELNVDDNDGVIYIILYREISGNAAPRSCRLTLAEGSDFASVDGIAEFAEGSGTAKAALRYRPSRMGTQRRTAKIVLDESGKSWSVAFTKSDAEWADGGTMLMFDGDGFCEFDAKYRRDGDRTGWILSRGNIERRFSVAKGSVEVVAGESILPASAYGQSDLWPATGVESYFSDDFIALNVCGFDNGVPAIPHTEYFFRIPGSYATATICDGWLLPVLAIDAKLLDPRENQWKAPARIEKDGCVTVFGPYHNGSPVHRVNGAALSAAWRIDISGTRADIAPQFSGFKNTDVFDFDFMITATGSFNVTTSELFFPQPLHNCNESGFKSGNVDCHWGNMLPTSIVIGPVSSFEHQ